MFKKDRDLVDRSQTLMKNKEIKSLRAELVSQFPRLQAEELETLLTKKANVTCIKLASRTILYCVDGIPFVFDKEGRNNLFPTVFFLWQFPHALRTMVVHSPVSKFIMNGADLMLAGLSNNEGINSFVILLTLNAKLFRMKVWKEC